MEIGKRECLTSTSDAQVHKSSNILDMREVPTPLGSPEVDDVEEVEEPQTVVAMLPSESQGANNRIHVQLFDGQVIHITSSALGGTGGGGKEAHEGTNAKKDNTSCFVDGGEIGSDGSTVTLIAPNGKIFVLPHPLTAAEDGSYLIPDEVLNTDEVLHGASVLSEDQMLTISPPPPQPTLDFTSSVTSHPDALAIATSEVFSEDYVSVPLQTQDALPDQPKTCRLKKTDTESPQQVGDEIYVPSRPDSQSKVLVLPDASVITINASDFAFKRVKKTSDKALNSKESTSLSVPCCKIKDVKDCSDEVKQVQPGSMNSSVYSKLVSIQNNATSMEYTVTSLPRVCDEQAEQDETKVIGDTKTLTEEEERDERSTQHASANHIYEGRSKLDVRGKARLRRSSRIRKVKRISNEIDACQEESELTEEASSGRRRCMKGETPSALWECGSCDAMFRTRVGRDRHLRESHAFTCYVCGWEGHSKTKYELHISTVHCNQQARCLACRKDFPGYEAYKQHMKEVHSTTTTTTTTTTVGTSSSTSTSSSLATTPTITSTTTTPSTAVKMEVESDVKLEEQVERDDQSGIINEENQNPNNTDLKSLQSQGERSCPYCSKTFSRRSRFMRHLNYHLGNRTFMCKICSKCFVEKSGLDAHLLTHCPINKECGQCGKVFKTERTMTRHLRTHSNVTYTCNVCNKHFRHEESLRVHKVVHKEGGSGNVCSVCEKDCKTPHYLQLHMSTKHEAAKFTCHQCNRSFKWKQSYRKHMAIHHGGAYSKFKCSLCSRNFVTNSELQQHQVVHSSEKKHLCDVCGKGFKHEYTRDKHTKTVHKEDREHMCPKCGTLFKAKAYLDQHLAHVHTTKERVVCKYCGNDFKTEANLRSHVKIVHEHRSPKYTCKTCHKMFLAPKDLLRHSKVHTGVKDYVCPRCPRCFSRKDNMLAHLRTHNVPQDDSDPSQSGVPDPAVPQASHQAAAIQEIPHILSLPSSNTSDIPSVSSSNIILSSTPTTTGNIVLSEVSPVNSIVLSGGPSSQTSAIATSVSSCVTAVRETPAAPHRVSLPVSSMAGVTSMPPSSTGIIFSSVAVPSFHNASVSPSSCSTVVTGGTPSISLAHSTTDSMSGSSKSSSPSSLSVVDTSVSSPIINLNASIPLTSGAAHPNHQAYSIHSELVVSSPNQVSNISPLLTASPVQSTVLSLPPSHSTSSPVLVSQNSRTQVVCSTLQGEQVVLTAGPLTPISKVSIHDAGPPQYSQLDPLTASVCSAPSSMNVAISPLSTSVASAATGLNATLGDVSLSAESTPNTSSVDGPDSVESNIILPTSSILQEAAIILPEKSGLYTIVGGGGKITPLETLTLHPVPPPASHPD